MGINTTALKFILSCRSKFDINFTQTATLGRLEIKKTRDKIKLLGAPTLAESIFTDNYCDNLLKYLGADTVDSFDYSDYEKATFVVDMNLPISEDHQNKYTLLIDGGTTEHIFHVPNAYKNMMDMVRVGGHILCFVPTNNWCGHGFYQFSPEFYHNLFSVENGFSIEVVAYACGASAGGGIRSLWEIPNPVETKKFVQLHTTTEALLFVCAKKICHAKDLTNPQQSWWKYDHWNTGSKAGLLNQFKKNRFLNAILPTRLKWLVVRTINRQRLKKFV